MHKTKTTAQLIEERKNIDTELGCRAELLRAELAIIEEAFTHVLKADLLSCIIPKDGSVPEQPNGLLSCIIPKDGSVPEQPNGLQDADMQNQGISDLCEVLRECLPGAYLSWTHTYHEKRLTKLRFRADAGYCISKAVLVGECDNIDVLKYQVLSFLVQHLEVLKAYADETYGKICIHKALIADWEDDCADCADTDQFGVGIFHKYV